MKASHTTTDPRWPIVGHDAPIAYLQRSAREKTHVHAYVFFGVEHLGKFTIARLFSRLMLCERGTGCGVCDSCRHFARGAHPDYYEIERDSEKKNISIESVRDRLIRPLHLSSFFHSFKIGVVNQAHELSLEAANSLLKTLEEPSERTLLLLVTSAREHIPKTLISRCQPIEFRRVTDEAINQYLQSDYPNLDRQTQAAIARLAQGRPGLACTLARDPLALEQLLESYRSAAGIILQPLWQRFTSLEELLPRGTFQENTERARQLVDRWQVILREALFQHFHMEHRLANPVLAEPTRLLASRLSPRVLLDHMERLAAVRRALNSNAQPHLQLEHLLLSFT